MRSSQRRPTGADADARSLGTNPVTTNRHRRVVLGRIRMLWLVLVSGWSFADGQLQAQSPIVLRDVTAQTGITFRHDDGSRGNYYLVEAMSAGVALFDYDRDGDIDIYFLCSRPANEPANSPEPRASTNGCMLYRNDGNWQFTDVTKQARVGFVGFALGVVAGDYDGDGDLDLYLNNYGPNVLYRNNGDGTFTDVTREANVANGHRVGAGAAFLDIDADGDLDLYVANYIQFRESDHVHRSRQGYTIYGSPADYPPDSDTLYRNNGDGTFTDVSREAGITDQSPSMGMVCADFDRDGDTDIFVASDGQANRLYQNDGHGHFQEIALQAGFAYDLAGKPHAGMGVDCADYDNDGWLDFHVTSFQLELATLYRNAGEAFFEDVTIPAGVGTGTRAPVTWGNAWADFDNDGHRDLLIAAGHLNDTLHHYDQSTHYEVPKILMRNLGNGRFQNISDTSGDGIQLARSSRGLAVDDLDGDGDLDVVVLNSRREPSVLRNDSPRRHHWLQIDLRGQTTNRDAVGARVELTAGRRRWVDELHAGRGYQSHFGTQLQFGLGDQARVDKISVHWLGGKTEEWTSIAADQRIMLTESQRAVKAMPFRTSPE